jgi:hypothetical protein
VIATWTRQRRRLPWRVVPAPTSQRDEAGSRVLFFLRSANFDRLFGPLLEALVERGHDVTVVVEKEKALGEGAGAALAALAQEHERFSYEHLAIPGDRWGRIRHELRVAVDYLRYLEPEYRDAPALRARARRRASRGVRILAWPLRGSAPARELARRTLLRLQRLVPTAAPMRALVAERDPDLVLVAPLVSIGSPQAEWIRIAAELGIPSAFPVASWDNLTNKGVLQHIPSLTIVWNEAQASEAIEQQRVPRERVIVSGAHSYDHWFERTPSTTREEFAALTGLEGTGPFLLYACSSRFITGDETMFVQEWLDRLRSSGSAALREIGVLIRPHPLNAEHWESFSPADRRTAVWPRRGALPTSDERRAGYFDSLHHSAGVVGVNTSALVEAAIARRPAFTVLDERHRPTQEGTLHFAQIADPSAGVLVVGRNWEEHLTQLDATLAGQDLYAGRIESFLARFVRPRGLDRPAAPIVVAALEDLVARTRSGGLPGARDRAIARTGS